MRDGTKTRARIEREAMRLFVDKGVCETSMRDIAQATGVVEGALYRHFESKDQLVRELFMDHYLGLGACLSDLETRCDGLGAKIDAMIGEFCDFFDRDPVLFRFLLLVQHHQLTRVPEGAMSPVAVIRRVIGAAMRRGEVARWDVDLATSMVIGMVLQSATSAVYRDVKPPLSHHAARLGAAARAILNTPANERRRS
jgi:AcrR family transcriptional regulator